jgi:uncharacterized RDD family membrane protein YckC
MAKTEIFDSADAAARRNIVTPEGMALPVFLARRGQRAGALILDLLFMLVATIVLGLICMAIITIGDSEELGISIYLLVSFLLRNFYFIFFELRWRGTTPGKRIMGLQVIDRKGGRLRADAIFARNLMREVEVFMPLSLLFSGGAVGSENWVVLLTLAWVAIFTLLPFFNKERLRAGDIVAGTWVVAAPRAKFHADLAHGGNRTTSWSEKKISSYQFTPEQLEAYGIFELQTLEAVLRQEGAAGVATRHAVADRIRKKIGWETGDTSDRKEFLEAYYRALRAHLEKRILMGKRRKDKYDTGK